ncbi:hypothetical protein CYMTET_37250 [Cymbomonas tetramitiformis]|uniref:Uncharacterized protein n=1 Tax=Cymbomonas tetramitiformis TaxID=36881 RepID=A0AAE0CFM8_9CHLO|nr:hypothetical protein CYMTET_37250 [Cymbomonas tetramitiformis]
MTTVATRMRSTSWGEKQRGQILSWTEASLADLQLLPEVVKPHTDALLASELFAVDSSGAIAVCPWPTGPGAAAPSGLIGASASGGGVSAGTAGATGTPGIGTAAAVSPDVIAAAITVALGAKLDEFGARLTSSEARGSAPAGVTLSSGGPTPVEAELLAQALRDSVPMVEEWDRRRARTLFTRLQSFLLS